MDSNVANMGPYKLTNFVLSVELTVVVILSLTLLIFLLETIAWEHHTERQFIFNFSLSLFVEQSEMPPYRLLR